MLQRPLCLPVPSEICGCCGYCIPGVHLSGRQLGLSSYFTYLFSSYTLYSFIKKTVQSYGFVGLSGLAIHSNSSNCLVLILHTQLGDFSLYIKDYTKHIPWATAVHSICTAIAIYNRTGKTRKIPIIVTTWSR